MGKVSFHAETFCLSAVLPGSTRALPGTCVLPRGSGFAFIVRALGELRGDAARLGYALSEQFAAMDVTDTTPQPTDDWIAVSKGAA